MLNRLKRRFGRAHRPLLGNPVSLDLEELRRGVLAALRVYGFEEGDYEALRALLEARATRLRINRASGRWYR